MALSASTKGCGLVGRVGVLGRGCYMDDASVLGVNFTRGKVRWQRDDDLFDSGIIYGIDHRSDRCRWPHTRLTGDRCLHERGSSEAARWEQSRAV